MILVLANKVEKIKYFSTLLGLIFIEITRGPLVILILNSSIDTNIGSTLITIYESYFGNIFCVNGLSPSLESDGRPLSLL